MKHTLLSAVIAGFVGSAAFAGSPDPYVEVEPVYMPPIEVETGADWEGFYAGGMAGIQSGEIAPIALQFDGTSYGGFAGYNFQSGKMVYGVEVAAQTGTVDLAPPALDLNYMIDAKARVGYAAGDALFFASGGYTTSSTDIFGGFDASGWNVGAGLDYAVTEKFFLGGEYTYRNLPNTNFPALDASSHGGQVRAGIRF